MLDADNWFESDHIATLLDAHNRSGSQVVTVTRTLRRPDESLLGLCLESNGQTFNDTNCYLITKDVFYIFSTWGFKDPRMGVVGDRIFWNNIVRGGFSRTHVTRPTVNYVTTWANHYLVRGEVPPAGAKIMVEPVKGQFKLTPYVPAE